MGYGYETKLVWLSEEHTTTADNLNSAADAPTTFKITEPIRVVEVGMIITTACTVTATVAFDRRPTVGSDTNRGTADVGQLIIPTTATAGKYVWSNAIKIDLNVGDEIVPEVTSAGTGQGHYVIKYFNRNEVMSEQSDAIESA